MYEDDDRGSDVADVVCEVVAVALAGGCAGVETETGGALNEVADAPLCVSKELPVIVLPCAANGSSAATFG